MFRKHKKINERELCDDGDDGGVVLHDHEGKGLATKPRNRGCCRLATPI